MSSRAETFNALNALREIESTSVQHSYELQQETAKKYRKILKNILVSLFGDLDKASRDLQHISPTTEKIFACLKYCMEEFSFIFVWTSSGPEPMDCDNEDLAASDDFISLTFSKWFISQMLRLLSSDKVPLIHDPCCKVLVNLFSMMRVKNNSVFQRFSSEYIQMLTDVHTAVDNMYQSDCCTPHAIKQFALSDKEESILKMSENSKDLGLQHSSIIVGDPVQGEAFQLRLMNITKQLLLDFVLYLPTQMSDLLHLLTTQIKLCDLELKRVSLDIVTLLLESNSFYLTSDEQSYLLSCLEALLLFCCQGQLESLGGSMSLERSLCRCLHATFFKLSGFHSTTDIASSCEVILTFTKAISGNGLQNLRTEALKKEVLYIVSSLLEAYRKSGISPNRILLKNILDLMLSYVGFKKTSNIYIPALVSLTQTEVSFSAELLMDTSRPVFGATQRDKTISAPVIPCLSPEVVIENLKSSAVNNKLQELLYNAAQGAANENLLLGINICLEVLLQSALACSVVGSSDSSVTFGKDEAIDAVSGMYYLDVVNILKTVITAGISSPDVLLECIKLSALLLKSKDLSSSGGPQASLDRRTLGMLVLCPWLTILQNNSSISIQLPVNISSTLVTSEHLLETIKLFKYVPLEEFSNIITEILKHIMAKGDEKCKIDALHFMQFFLMKETLEDLSLLLPFLNDISLETSEALVSFLKNLPCIITRKAEIKWMKTQHQDNFERCIYCHVCSEEQLQESCKILPSTLTRDLFQILTKLCQSPNKGLKRSTLHCLENTFRHVPLELALVEVVMDLLEDQDYGVRVTLSKLFKVIVQNLHLSNGSSEIKEFLISRIGASFTSAQSIQNVGLQETILLTISQIGQAASEDLLMFAVINLIENLMTNIPLVAVVAKHELDDLALAKNCQVRDLFKMFKVSICKFLFEVLLNNCTQTACPVEELLLPVASVFGYAESRYFLKSINRYILPLLVMKADVRASKLLKFIARTLRSRRRDVLLDNFMYIFSYLVRNCSTVDQQKALEFVEKETNLEIGSVLRCDFQKIHNELLLHISTHYDQVFSGLALLAWKDENYHGPKPISTAEDMAEFLHPRLLGFLTFFDLQLLNPTVLLEDKKLALKSLISIMELMGPKHITTVKMKLMATLKIALKFTEDGFAEICCLAWKTFVKSVELPSLGPLLSQIVATLLPLLKQNRKGVLEIFRFLIIVNKEHLKEYFHDLYFVSEVPGLEEINSVIKECTLKPSSESNFFSLITNSLNGITHENLDVHLLALTKLKDILSSNQVALSEYLLIRESLDPVVSRLVSQLLQGCRETDSRIQQALAECIGELGAIDPGRLELKAQNMAEATKVHKNVEEEDFAFDLLQELARSFLAAEEARVQDCSSYAIQEVLQIYKCSNTVAASTFGGRLWNRFTPEIQEIFTPLLNSRYITSSNVKNPELSHPIFNSDSGKTFKDWISNWTVDLLQKVKQEKASQVFQSCAMIIKHDTNTALFLLPYVLVTALTDCSEKEKKEIMTEVLYVLKHCEMPKQESHASSELVHMSAQTVFSILNHLVAFTRQQASSPKSTKSTEKLDDSPQQFISRIPQDLLARVSYNCHAYTRALMHAEMYIRENKNQLGNHLHFFQKIYVALDEPDGISGVAAVRRDDVSLEDQIIEHEATGKLQDAFACYERAIRLESGNVMHHQGLLKCLMGLDQPSTALTHASGLLHNRPVWNDDINPYRVEAAWKLCSWDGLENFLNAGKQNKLDNWSIGVGNILLSAHNQDKKIFLENLKVVRSHQMGPLSAASMESEAYQRGYQYIVRLHMLTEVEKCMQGFFNLHNFTNPQATPSEMTDKLLNEWNIRRRLVQSSPRFLEPMLKLHRVLLCMAKDQYPDLKSKLDTEIVNCWLQSARLARKCGHLQQAYSCLLETETLDLPKVFLEKAKWLWAKNEQERAISVLQKGIEKHFDDYSNMSSGSTIMISTPESHHERLACAKAKLLLAKYSEESAAVESTQLMKMYKSVVNTYNSWEDGSFHLAKYSDTLINIYEMPEKKAELMLYIVKNYGQSLKHGCKHVYHSMPRVLSIWFDLGSQVAEMNKSKKPPSVLKTYEQYLKVLTTKIIANLTNELPPYLFFTAFPQLISRICHSYELVSRQLQTIIAKLLVTYPQQTVWMMISVSKSSYPVRVERCQEIFTLAKQRKPELVKFLHDIMTFADLLLELCNKRSNETSNTFLISQHVKQLHRLLEQSSFSKILLPQQSAMTVSLPSGPNALSNHDAFPQELIFIHGFEDKCEVLSSLQKPKKVTLRGSDGKKYPMMLKPKDDLRKDCRLMEFNNLINRYLKQDPEARRTKLHIRTYNVVPLNEECGLIEWISNLGCFRHILYAIYKQKGLFTPSKEVISVAPKLSTSVEEKLRIFKEKLLPKFPPVFFEWFLKTFPDPTAWYMARLAYARTTAVMSIVGYMVGLGDRHGENILFDASCGDVVHVDFNCLFNKGETFDWPERVPFRLTHNMIDAMGPLGYEGIFRKSCEATLRVMRNQTDALMSVLKPFIHDPLVEWSQTPRSVRAPTSNETGEINNEKALVNVNGIEQRLKGVYRGRNKAAGPPLSVEGQVNYLIQEATSGINLCQMYVGWGSFL